MHLFRCIPALVLLHYQPTITCSNLTIEILEQGVKYIQVFSVSIVNFELVNEGWVTNKNNIAGVFSAFETSLTKL